jgi:hypothetical protein
MVAVVQAPGQTVRDFYIHVIWIQPLAFLDPGVNTYLYGRFSLPWTGDTDFLFLLGNMAHLSGILQEMKSCNKKLQAWHTMGGLPSTCEAHNSC